MEVQEENENSKKTFFEYVFNFDNSNSAQLGNIYQFCFLALPLVLLSLKTLNYISAEVDETKGTLEILIEVFISINWILLSIWFINKIVRYIPTRSKMPYPIFNETNFILPLLIVLLTMNTKFGIKINILIERMVDLYDGKTNLKDNTNNVKNNKDIKSTQPISHGANTGNIRLPPPGTIEGGFGMQNVNIEPRAMQSQGQQSQGQQSQGQQSQGQQGQQQQQQQHNFNNDFAGPNINNLLSNEPIAANEIGGGAFGSVF